MIFQIIDMVSCMLFIFVQIVYINCCAINYIWRDVVIFGNKEKSIPIFRSQQVNSVILK